MTILRSKHIAEEDNVAVWLHKLAVPLTVFWCNVYPIFYIIVTAVKRVNCAELKEVGHDCYTTSTEDLVMCERTIQDLK